jgi:hypothetical protein
MMFVSISEHFNNLLHVKRCKTCVSGMNALFRATKVVKHSFYSIGPKMTYRNVSERFANLRHVKDAKLVFPAWMNYFGAPKLRSIHSTPLYPKWCLGVFQSISMYKDAKLVFRPLCTISGHYSCEASILLHCTQNDIRDCYGALR